MVEPPSEPGTFFANILTPGSSLNPTFLLILDGAFSFLLFVLLVMAYITSWNGHIFALIGLELALWASVKWFVNELKSMQTEDQNTTGGGDTVSDGDIKKRL